MRSGGTECGVEGKECEVASVEGKVSGTECGVEGMECEVGGTVEQRW